MLAILTPKQTSCRVNRSSLAEKASRYGQDRQARISPARKDPIRGGVGRHPDE
jgi:hypothetical protein